MLIISLLFVGIFIGMKLFPIKYSKINDCIQITLLCALIFCLGVKLGLRPNLIDEITNMGIRSALLAVIPTVFSILGVFAVEKFIIYKNKKKDKEDN